jgi:hypothetical protein
MTGGRFLDRAVLFGQVFEIAAKRGVIASLLARKLIDAGHPALAPWRELRLERVYHAVTTSAGAVDQVGIGRLREATWHLLGLGYSLGFTAGREYLKRQPAVEPSALRALYCPLTLPSLVPDAQEREEQLRLFSQAFGVFDEALMKRGWPSNSDFLLWLDGGKREDQILAVEFSFDAREELPDFLTEEAHLDELLRYVQVIDQRGVFSKVCAEVDEEHFELASDLTEHLSAFTSENKPFFKLCQGASYVETLVHVLTTREILKKPCLARALAVTPNGFESLAARYSPTDPRWMLMKRLGKAYRKAHRRERAPGDLEREIALVFRQISHRLPTALRQQLAQLERPPAPGEDIDFRFHESMDSFYNPNSRLDRGAALELVADEPSVGEYLKGRPRERVGDYLHGSKPADEVTLRDLHAATVRAALASAVPGELRVIALEGSPGIGKTTAVVNHLQEDTRGSLFLYVSPRVVINRDVTEKLAYRNGSPTGCLTVTTNSILMGGAETYYRQRVAEGTAPQRRVQGAVVVDGVKDLVDPKGNILLLSPEEEHELESKAPASRLGKRTLNEHEDLVEERPLVGVLRALASTTRHILAKNPSLQRVALTAAIQGFREKAGGGTTIQALSELFRSKASTPAGLTERRAFAARIPQIIVMLDEITGDGTGAPFVHEIASWLDRELFHPFLDAGQPPPFTVILIVADASLGNETVMDRYINAGARAPDKVLVSRSVGSSCFRVTAGLMKVGGAKRRTLHVMANSFPSSQLELEYGIHLQRLRLLPRREGELESVRDAIKREAAESFFERSLGEVQRALSGGAGQVIFFAQDKLFLRKLQEALVSPSSEQPLEREQVKILDSSIPPGDRKQLVQPAVRDRVRVFLMTSSGARGVSFPRADWIIVSMPRFRIETALMELAQLIYRGRGGYVHPETGKWTDGDNVPRRLVTLVEDFLPDEGTLDPRQWLRRAVDLLSIVTLIRATIFTRITGDSGFQRQRIAIVPVGGIGTEELFSLMSRSVGEFLEEANVLLASRTSEEHRQRVGSAIKNVRELFANFALRGQARVQGLRSFVRETDITDFLTEVSLPTASLLPEAVGAALLPDHVYCVGPYWLESWRDYDKHEEFWFEGWQTAISRISNQLFGQLREIDKDESYPTKLRRPAANLLRVLARDKKDAALEFSTRKVLQSPNTWVVIPVAYPRFLSCDPQRPTDRPRTVKDPQLWRDALGRAVSANLVLPVIPIYDGFPYTVTVGAEDPANIEVIFDDRYFMASSELNLLNCLLLADE